MPKLPAARWWSVRAASNRKPSTYRCPICGHLLPALGEHVLIAPEGDKSRRRHAHMSCVLAARKAGDLLLEEDWRRAQRGGDAGGVIARLLNSARGRSPRRRD
ncbi:MAG: hypothetical protein ACYCUM_06610 [Solirubrobacteraceae bacterium]